MSSANRQNSSRIRKWAAAPGRRRAARRLVGQAGELGRRPLGHLRRASARAAAGPARRTAPAAPPAAAAGTSAVGSVAGQVGQVEGVDLLDGAGEVGVDLEAVQVADHQQRRVLQVLAVLEQLLVGGRRGSCACPCTPRRSGRASRRRRSPPRRRSSSVPFSKAYASPVGSASCGVGCPSSRHRSRKCSCAAARSVVVVAAHF